MPGSVSGTSRTVRSVVDRVATWIEPPDGVRARALAARAQRPPRSWRRRRSSEACEGCCPLAFSIDTITIAPGESATLGFELSMHAGMDGWHDIAVHVPLRAGSTDHVLEVDVNGDFTDT